MRGLWQCSGCAGLLVLGISTQSASANREGDGEYEVHWVEKSLNLLQHVRRKDVCSNSWSLCPSSVGGGCCPEYFECGTASCYATTAGPTSCGGYTGYYACGLTDGPGTCCPVGFICNDSGGCIPPPGVSISQSCQPDWFGCPVSLGGGCCRNGWSCGTGVCYDNTPMTFPVSETKTTTDSRGHATITVVTSLTTITNGPNTDSDSATVVEIPQLIPSTVAKMDAIQTGGSTGGGGGLSSGALGGIVTGVIVILIAIVVAATFIVLRLKKAERAARDAEKVAESRHESDSQPRSHKSGFGQLTVSEIDSTTDVDPLNRLPIMVQSPQMRSRSTTAGTADLSPSPTPNFIHSGTSSPPLWGTSFNYAPSVASDGRQSSLDSYPRHDNGTGRTTQRVSIDSQTAYGHSRQPSDTSELEEQHGRSELSGGNNEVELQRRSNSITRLAKTHSRRNSDISGQNRVRGDSNAGAGTLGTVKEMYDELHGYFGPQYTAAGQTAATTGRGPSPAPGRQDT